MGNDGESRLYRLKQLDTLGYRGWRCASRSCCDRLYKRSARSRNPARRGPKKPRYKDHRR